MAKSKKITNILLVLVILLAVIGTSFGGTYAYLFRTFQKKNIVTVGETKIETKEEYNPPDELKPGMTFTKKPWVRNTGTLPCFVRTRVDFSSSNLAGPNNLYGLCTLNYDTTNWTYNPTDGYWYYKRILMPGESTEATPLFSTVTVRNDLTEKEFNKAYREIFRREEQFSIYVYSEARQSERFAADKYMSTDVWEA